MQINQESQFIPHSDDEKNKILDPKWIKRKKQDKLKLKGGYIRNMGVWTKDENIIYLFFLEKYRDDFQNEHSRRAKKVFNRLSAQIKNRSSQQCRRHFQKLQSRCGSQKIDEIIKFINIELEKESEVERIKTSTCDQDLKQKGYLICQLWLKNCLSIKILLQDEKIGSW